MGYAMVFNEVMNTTADDLRAELAELLARWPRNYRTKAARITRAILAIEAPRTDATTDRNPA